MIRKIAFNVALIAAGLLVGCKSGPVAPTPVAVNPSQLANCQKAYQLAEGSTSTLASDIQASLAAHPGALVVKVEQPTPNLTIVTICVEA